MKRNIGKVVRQRKTSESGFITGGRLGVIIKFDSGVYLIAFKGYKQGHGGDTGEFREDMVWLSEKRIKLVRSKNK